MYLRTTESSYCACKNINSNLKNTGETHLATVKEIVKAIKREENGDLSKRLEVQIPGTNGEAGIYHINPPFRMKNGRRKVGLIVINGPNSRGQIERSGRREWVSLSDLTILKPSRKRMSRPEQMVVPQLDGQPQPQPSPEAS